MKRCLMTGLLATWISLSAAGCIPGSFCPSAPIGNRPDVTCPRPTPTPTPPLSLNGEMENGKVIISSSFIDNGSGGVSESWNDRLVIRTFPEMDLLMDLPFGNSRTFSLSFIHSVTMTPVQDQYEVALNGDIHQTSEIFESHCAGLPFSDQETGATFWEQKDGKFILHMKREIPKLVVRTDRRYRNRLHIQNRVIDLNQWEDQALLIEVTR